MGGSYRGRGAWVTYWGDGRAWREERKERASESPCILDVSQEIVLCWMFLGGVGYGVACTLSLLTAICGLRSLQTWLDTPDGESWLLVKKQIHLLNILFCVAVLPLAWLPPEAFIMPRTRPISICDGGLGFQMKCPHLWPLDLALR